MWSIPQITFEDSQAFSLTTDLHAHKLTTTQLKISNSKFNTNHLSHLPSSRFCTDFCLGLALYTSEEGL
jgi:hypothetical protein